MNKPSPESPNYATVGVAKTHVRIVHGGGAAIQLRYEDKETFAEILIQIRVLGERASPEMADYMRRNLIQEAGRMKFSCIAEKVL